MFHMSGAPNIDSDGNVTGAVGTFRDITELKKIRIGIMGIKSSTMEAN